MTTTTPVETHTTSTSTVTILSIGTTVLESMSDGVGTGVIIPIGDTDGVGIRTGVIPIGAILTTLPIGDGIPTGPTVGVMATTTIGITIITTTIMMVGTTTEDMVAAAWPAMQPASDAKTTTPMVP